MLKSCMAVSLFSMFRCYAPVSIQCNVMPIPVAERSQAWVCSRSPAGIAGSNPLGLRVRIPPGDGCLCCVCCTVRTKRQSQDNQDKEVQRTKKNPAGGMDVFVCCECCVCCQVEVSVTGRSLVARSPTDCGVSLRVIKWIIALYT